MKMVLGTRELNPENCNNLLEDEKIVISGLSGVFPESKNIYELQKNLHNKVDLVNSVNNRWNIVHPEIPNRTGKIPNIEKFDAGFFGIHYRQAQTLDPMVRILLEKVIEAIMDAGINPSELEGTNTGVYIGSSFSETEAVLLHDGGIEPQNFAITGCIRALMANRISYHLKLKGPSHNSDTACSSSLIALNQAYMALRMGVCDQAIVGGVNLCLQPYVTLQFSKLGVLSKDGQCKVFDADGNGYVRSEAAGIIFLQKLKSARRNYGEIVHAKANCDGFTPESIHFPSRDLQSELLKECYEEANINPRDLTYMEAHGTATFVGDPEEVAAIDSVICSKRSKPLLVGSVKSNVGHSEPSSGFSSVVKAVLIMEHKIIPPNLHFYKARKGVEPLENGRLKVITENTKIQEKDVLIGVSSFGFGGANAHVILRSNRKQKILPSDDLPRLVCVSGRVREAVSSILDDLKKRDFNIEYVALYHQVFQKNIKGHWWRGFSVIGKHGEISRSIEDVSDGRRIFGIVFGDVSETWLEISKDLLSLPLYLESVQKTQQVLKKHNVDIVKILQRGGRNKFDKILGTAAVQMALIDVIKSIKLDPDYIVGVGIGEFLCGYFEGGLTREEVLRCIFEVAVTLEDSEVVNGEIQINGDVDKFSKLLYNLKSLIGKPKQRSSKWLSNFKETRATAEYFVKALLSNKYSTKLLTEGSAAFLIGDVQSKDFGIKNVDVLRIRNHTESVVVTLFEVLGSLYKIGFDMEIHRLYPKIQFPVACGTPMISPLIKWNHDRDYFVALYKPKDAITFDERRIEIDISDDQWSYVTGHMIEERNLFPATGYIYLVLETLAMTMNRHISDMQVVFEKCKFLRATNVSAEKKTSFLVTIQRGTGDFEVVEGGSVVVTGRIYILDDISREQIEFSASNEPTGVNLQTKDIYKELRLRGYNYKGAFKQIKEMSADLSYALVKWNDNWVSFMDNLLQVKILQVDTRLLYVPTCIERLSIDTKKHVNYAQKFGENPDLPVYFYENCDIIKSGGIEIRGLKASSIAKKKVLEEPVLEKYVFVPNSGKLDLVQALRVNMQIVLENAPTNKMKVVELLDQVSKKEVEVLGPLIHQVLSDMPSIQPEVTVLSKQSLDLPNVAVSNKILTGESDCNVVVGSKLLERLNILQDALKVIKSNGYIISRECLATDCGVLENVQVVTSFVTNLERIVLLQRTATAKLSDSLLIPVSSLTEFSWLKPLQDAIDTKKQVIVYSYNEPLSGILGLVNCIRREPGKNDVKCVFVSGDAPKFDLNNAFYAEQLNKNLAVNVFKNQQWGTYRHLSLEKLDQVKSEHCYVNTLVKGDLTSLRWLEGPLKSSTEQLVHVYYTSLNFKDVMLATGRIHPTGPRLSQDCVLGFEFSGRRSNGDRVMGMIPAAALSTLILESSLIWEVPDDWTLEQAATVPCVYSTVLYATAMRTQLRKGDSILIHSGSGGIGQAAINLALHKGCTVYTTVGTEDKRKFIKHMFPQISDNQIGNSRDSTFEQMIYRETKGRGVDFVLNSLAEEKLQASVRCLAKGGKFLEIGKFDLMSDNNLRLLLIEKQASFHGVMLDLFMDASLATKNQLRDLLLEGIANKSVRPLSTTVFNQDETEKAFRYMTTGKHMGKIVLKIREEEADKKAIPTETLKSATPRYNCNPEEVFVILGGLGGFGLELVDWLVIRGARKLVLTSRKGVSTGYQSLRIKRWKSYGVTVKISTVDITTNSGCEKLIQESKALGPVMGIFNLAVILQDSVLENQSVESFKLSLGPKAWATEYLDVLTRKHCPDLRDFVVFSSVSCGRGNGGQSNYGMSNSVMERICEKRRQDGFPGLAIEWGAVGDVGIVADMQEEHIQEMEIGGTLQQRITSCLQVLDIFLKQNNPVVSSIIVAKKKSGDGQGGNVVEIVAGILGIKDLKTVSLQIKLSELGMDSMTAVEIQQTLEREFQITLTTRDIRSLTFAGLQELQEKMSLESQNVSENSKGLLEILSRFNSDEASAQLQSISLQSRSNKISKEPELVFFPGIEGVAKTLEPLSKNLTHSAHCVQFTYENTGVTVQETAQNILPSVEKLISKSKPFKICAYSYGTVVALEVVSMLEKKGYTGNVVCIDGSPDMLCQLYKSNQSAKDESHYQTNFIVHTACFTVPQEIVVGNAEKILAAAGFQKKLDVIESLVPSTSKLSARFIRDAIDGIFKRVEALKDYKPCYKLKSNVSLYKPTDQLVSGLAEDYNLSELCEDPVQVKIFKGHHVNVVENQELAEAINRWGD